MASLSTRKNELQQQTYAQGLELEDAHLRICRNSKRASSTARRVSHERESTSRQSDLKYSPMGELKRAQEVRVDEFFSVQKLRKS